MKMTCLTNRIIKVAVIVCAMIFCVNSSVCSNNKTKLHRVVKIERIGETYIIHTERNDSLFKIVSGMLLHRIDTKLYDYEPLVIGNYYSLNLSVIVPFSFCAVDDISDHSFYHMCTDDWGKGKKLKPDSKSHYRIYTSINLNGLYYVKPKEYTTTLN